MFEVVEIKEVKEFRIGPKLRRSNGDVEEGISTVLSRYERG